MDSSRVCHHHPGESAVAHCGTCQTNLCNNCIINVHDQSRCKNCNSENVQWLDNGHLLMQMTDIDYIVDMVNKSEISSIKSIVSNLLVIINDPKSTADDLKKVIEIDPPLSARILKLANSVYYASRKKMNALNEAIIWIGYDAVKELALRQKVCKLFIDNESVNGFSRLLLWKHSVAVALLAKMIYKKIFREKGEDIYIAGLLHDLGIIAENQFRQDEFREILKKVEKERLNLIEAEKTILGYNHEEIGRAITLDWNLPEDLVMAIGYHHHPTSVAPKLSKIVLTLYIADFCCHEYGIGWSGGYDRDNTLFMECCSILGIKVNSLDVLIKNVGQKLQKMEESGVL